jgi:ABC-type antimicrobial peptide transport system permease subunit
MTTAIHDHFNALSNELIQTGAVRSIAESGSPTTGVWNGSSGFSWKGKDPNLSIDFGNVDVSVDYGKTIAWKIKEGRDFSRDFSTDTSAFILNEAAVQFMDLKKTLGETITWWGQPYTVIGVVSNMVLESPYDEARPIIYNLSNYAGNVAIVRINPAFSAKDAIGKIAPVFKKFDPDQPFSYKFTDDEYATKFSNEKRVGKLAGFFAVLAIAISCLGLFGLTAFVAEQRKKEIAVRKVLGASVINVWDLLSRDFVSLFIISFLIAVPLSYFFMHSWLQHYPYRVSITWWVFAAAGAGALVLTLCTVSFQAIRAAVMNPMKSLRAE